jgi:hypothetical protein
MLFSQQILPSATVEFAVSELSVLEYKTTVTVTIKRTENMKGTVAVHVTTQAASSVGSAIAGIDYTPITDLEVGFGAGEVEKTVSLAFAHDGTHATTDKTIELRLFNAQNAVLGVTKACVVAVLQTDYPTPVAPSIISYDGELINLAWKTIGDATNANCEGGDCDDESEAVVVVGVSDDAWAVPVGAEMSNWQVQYCVGDGACASALLLGPSIGTGVGWVDIEPGNVTHLPTLKDPSATSLTVRAVTATSYAFRMRVVSPSGPSPWSDPSAKVTTPALCGDGIREGNEVRARNTTDRTCCIPHN